jgi:hypothetical protein
MKLKPDPVAIAIGLAAMAGESREKAAPSGPRRGLWAKGQRLCWGASLDRYLQFIRAKFVPVNKNPARPPGNQIFLTMRFD